MYSNLTPGTPDSITASYAAGNFAHDKRNNINSNNNSNKSMMNYFRDRTPSYTRSNSSSSNNRLAPQASVIQRRPRVDNGQIVYLKEPPRQYRSNSSINKLALLKSSSTRDLSRLMEDDEIGGGGRGGEMSTSSSSSSYNRDFAPNHSKSNRSIHSSSKSSNHCDVNCKDNIRALERRISNLEEELCETKEYSKTLENKIDELSKRIDELWEQKEKKKKSNSMRKKMTQSNNAAINVQPSKLVAWMNLSNWWKHRPSIATLKEQNIYNDEPCFDTEIEMVLKHEVHKTVPKIVVLCCELIEEKYRKSTQPIEGIYRQCGDYIKIQQLRFSIDGNDYDALRHPNIDIHTLTGVLKLFLREIKSPLISTNEAKTFIGKPNQWLLNELFTKIDTLKRLIRSLPEVNRDTMDFIFHHFNKLTKVPLQNVSAETLSLSVTPSIFHTVQADVHMQDIHLLLKESEILSDCARLLIEYHSRIFE